MDPELGKEESFFIVPSPQSWIRKCYRCITASMPFSELTATQMTQSCCIETHSSRHICPCCKSGGVLLRVWMILFTTLFTFNNLCNLQPEWNCMSKRSKDRSKVKRGIYGAWRSCGFSCISALNFLHKTRASKEGESDDSFILQLS